eukprot:9429203-Alexandrium_andersonii.AAC.1
MFKQLRNMHKGSRRSKLELRWPRKGLNIAPRSSRVMDEGSAGAPEALSRSCLNSQLPIFEANSETP